MAKRFFYVCTGLLCLALAYHLGARSATAQAGSAVSGMAVANVGCGAEVFVLAPNGDVFRRPYSCGVLTGSTGLVGNFWGGATPARLQTWGSVKAKYGTPQGKAGQAREDK